ncbi:hypothetical protein MalM25_05230 [Planctomycetes bacterium MalM25]|nr:hypothetical protein MalM25_05230 [Planctomycetes bacterium MalM25]
MKLADFRSALEANPDCSLRVAFGQDALAAHFHVTEVGRVTKDFVDCGGVRRSETRCVLQTLVAGDTDHRLNSTKLAKIVALADVLDLPGEASVEVEHQERSVSTDLLDAVEREGDTLTLRLAPKQTACLAEDACGIGVGLPTLPLADGCCGGGSCD